MQFYILWIAVLASAVTFAVHTFVGGRFVAAPLLANTSLPKASKWLNYYCWHITTLYTFIMTITFVYIALNPEKFELVILLSIFNGAFSLLSILVAIKGNINPFRFPSTSLFATVALLGILSLLV